MTSSATDKKLEIDKKLENKLEIYKKKITKLNSKFTKNLEINSKFIAISNSNLNSKFSSFLSMVDELNIRIISIFFISPIHILTEFLQYLLNICNISGTC